jgi:phosphoenolpyruvate-protein phosphotransferase (PTS system enzyme I)
MAMAAKQGEKAFRGIPVSNGVCRGKVFILNHRHVTIPREDVPEEKLSVEIDRLEEALIQTRKQILEVQRLVNEALGADQANIFEAHLLVLDDPSLIDGVTRQIQNEKVNVAYAYHCVAEKFIETLSKVDDEYLRERAKDLRDVTNRVLSNLLGRPLGNELQNLREPCIIISEDLTPSVTAVLDKKMVLGFATDVGSKTSHTAILARSLQIPAIVGLKDVSQQLQNGQFILLDGFTGHLIVNPSDQTLFEYGQLVRRQVSLQEHLREVKDLSATSLDGITLILSANVEQPSDTEAVQAFGAQGVGLFRTEYLFISRTTLPSEEEQYQALKQVAVALKPNPVVIRTLDLGGDKLLSHLQLPPEMNPSLGMRAIRYCLQEPGIFRRQLRAILRASAEGNLKMMYPMISGLGELNQANTLLEECKAELRREKIPFNPDMEVGVMIEVPSAVMIAEALAQKVAFFSLGTNDLIQYTLAVDRMNERIAHLYEPTHPAILRMIKKTIEAAHKHGIWVGVCGEMAADLNSTPLLLGLGVDELSVTPSQVPEIKFLIRRLKASESRELAAFALACDSGEEILKRSRALARQAAPNLFEEIEK